MHRALFGTVVLAIGTCLPAQSFRTAVEPLPAEDLAQACHYELTLPNGDRRVLGLLVIYDRGPQITSFYSDSDVLAFAKRHDLGLLLAHQCNSKNAPGGPEEMDMDPTQGVGRALFTAMKQFGQQSQHPELSSSKLVVLGFSGTGALFAHFEEYAPARVIAAVLIHPAHYEPMALDRVQLATEGREVPELIFAGGLDKVATTQSPYDYFRRYRDQGAPWTFLVQNGTGHFGVSATKPLILAWLDDVLKRRDPDPSRPLLKINETDSWAGYIARCSPEARADATWSVCSAVIARSASEAPKNMMPAGWLPSKHVAELWLQEEKQSEP
jgi:dienelactone hydrolase